MLSKLLQPNRVKAARREGRMVYGYNLAFPSPWSGWVREILLEAGRQIVQGKQS